MVTIEVLEEHPAKIPGQVPLLLTTAAAIDWDQALEQVRRRGVDLEVLHAEQPAKNLDDLRQKEAGTAKDGVEARRAAWRKLVDLDTETRALREVLPLLRLLAPGESPVQDPRLQDVARIAEAEEAFWQTALGPTDRQRDAAPAAAPTPLLPVATSLRVAPAGPEEASAIAQALGEARIVVGQRRWIVARTAFAQVRTQCRDVGAHAAAVAERTRDPRLAERYRELAARCTAVVHAIDRAFAP